MDLKEAKLQAEKYLMQTYSPYPVLFTEGKGSYLYDDTHKSYLDFFSGIAVNNLGYSHPGVIEAITSQINKLMHVSNLYYTEPALEAAKALVEASKLDKVFFCNSGTEANEGALKLARLYGSNKGKRRIVSALNSFHGRSMGGLSLTGQTKYHQGFEPLIPEIAYTKYNDLEALDHDLTPDTAALILEPVQGESGVHPATSEYLQKARELCNERDILLIFDEVQTGIGRSGEFLAYQALGVKPDIITVAKGLGGGLPIGAVLAKEKVAVFTPGKHASTFGGNPVAAKAAATVVKEIANEKFLIAVQEKAAYLSQLLAKPHPLIKEVRGLGLMIGVELNIKANEVVKVALENGLVIGTAGESVVRLLPPLTITKEEIEKGIKLFYAALDWCMEGR